MKKKAMTMLLCATLVLGTTSGAFAAEKACSGNLNLQQVSGRFQNLVQEYLTKYFDKGSITLPGAPESDGSQEDNSGEENITEEETTQKPATQPSQNGGSYASQVVSLVNQERSAAGLGSLSSDSELTRLAQLKAEDMAAKGYFSHTSPTYGSAFDMLKDAGYSYRTAGENIAKGQKSAETVMNGWMNSSGHRANILGSGYTKIGVGYATDGNGTPYWVQIFAG